MDPWALFVLHVGLNAVFPFWFTALRSSTRLLYFYVYVAIVLTVGGFLGAVYAFPLLDGVTMSAGSVMYATLMMTTVMLVMVTRQLSVVRTVIKLVLVVTLFRIGIFSLTSWALGSPAMVNPFATSAEIFAVSVRSVLVGGGLIVAELLLVLVLFERLKTRVSHPVWLRVLYVCSFVAVLVLDGILFPLLAFPFEPDIAEIIAGGIAAKFVLGLTFAVPLTLFLLVYRRATSMFAATPLRLQDLLLAPPEELVEHIERGEAQRVQLLERLLTVAETERGRLAEELHDDAVQLVTAARHRLRSVTETDMSLELESVDGLLERTITSLRRHVLELHPPQLSAASLGPNVAAYGRLLFAPTGVDLSVRVDLPDDVDPAALTTTFEILSEALANVAHHAEATSATVHVGVDGPDLRGSVTDDGKGAPADPETPPGHLGLRAMRDRVERWNGTVEVGPRPDHAGTRVCFRLAGVRAA